MLHRRTGLLILALGFILAGVMLMIPVKVFAGHHFTEDDVIELRTNCGRPADIVRGRLTEEVVGANTTQTCTKAAWLRMAEVALVLMLAVPLAFIGWRAGPYRPPEPLTGRVRSIPSPTPDVEGRSQK